MTAYLPSASHFRDFVAIRRKRYAPMPVAAIETRCVFFSGLALVNGNLARTADAFERAAADEDIGTLSATGDFCAVFRNGSALTIVNDLFGMSPIFVFEDDDWVIAGNRLHAVVHAMKLEGIRRKPNHGQIFASLISDHVFFQQAHSFETSVAGLRMVPADEYVVLDGAELTTKKKRAFAAPLTRSDTYRGLIEQGAAEVAANVRAVAPAFQHCILSLSGGRDSRAVLGAAMRVNATDALLVYARENERNQDLNVALALTEKYGLRFFAGDERTRYATSAEFALTAWRSMKLGLHHRMPALNRWNSLATNSTTARLTGGGGELYRVFWSPAFAKFDKPNVKAMFEALIRKDATDPVARDAAFRNFLASVNSMDGDELPEKFEQHYLQFRNRLHFGVQIYNAYTDFLDLAPLMAPSLLRAASLMEPGRRARGDMIFDIVDRLAPELNFLPYDDGERWPDGMFKRSRSREQLLGSTLPASTEATRKAWHAANAVADTSTRRKGRPFPPETLDALVVSEANACLDAIRQADRMFAEHLPLAPLTLESANRNETASKLMAIFDLWLDTDTRVYDTGAPVGSETLASGYGGLSRL